MEMTGAVVIERQAFNTSKALSIRCPKCQASIGHYCGDSSHEMVHAERVVQVFANEAKPLVAPFGT